MDGGKRKCNRVEDLDVNDVRAVLEKWNMNEFIDFVEEKHLDGRKLLEVTEGIVKLWRPKVNAKKFISFVQDLKRNQEKYLETSKTYRGISEIKTEQKEAVDNKIKALTTVSIESQYQTVSVKRTKEENLASVSVGSVEEILKKIVPPKSFLYRNQSKKTDKTISYVPMEGSPQKRPKRFFRLSSYEYPFEVRRTSKPDAFSDRGYYSVKTNSRYYIQKTPKKSESRTKYKSLGTTEELNENLPEDHFYEDLCYYDIEKKDVNDKTDQLNVPSSTPVPVKPCIVKIQELFQSFKLPFFKRNEVTKTDKNIPVNEKKKNTEEEKPTQKNSEGHIYENTDSIANMYDSVHIKSDTDNNDKGKEQNNMAVEDYLEPIQANKDYCDVNCRDREDSLLAYIMNIFEHRFGMKRETNEANQSEISDECKDTCTPPSQKWPDRKHKTNMAERPLPVPVENEPYYMSIDRSEAENLLKGQPDGTFILRPSSQPSHAYTLSVACSNSVHNVGVRRRSDGRLALGYARRAERSFASIPSLLRHHRRRRLLLVAAGNVLGATTLTEPPHYYQSPSSIPVAVPSIRENV